MRLGFDYSVAWLLKFSFLTTLVFVVMEPVVFGWFCFSNCIMHIYGMKKKQARLCRKEIETGPKVQVTRQS